MQLGARNMNDQELVTAENEKSAEEANVAEVETVEAVHEAEEETTVEAVLDPEAEPDGVGAMQEVEAEAEIGSADDELTSVAGEDASPASDTSVVPDEVGDDADEPNSILALARDQHLSGKVKNIAGFGAFVDIGLPQDGLIHISELSRKKVDKVEDVVSVGQDVDVWVKKVDRKRGRISLTMVKPISLRLRDIAEGAELEGTISRLESYGAFIDIGSERDGLVHISQITHEYIKHPEDVLTVGEPVRVRVIKVNRKKRQVDLSIKALLPLPEEAVEEVPDVEEVLDEETAENDPVPTAMALAYAAMKDKKKPNSASKETDDTKDKQKQEMDEIVARTLATSD
jgi:transcriptional accessory protein Tex/SPT6